MIPFAKEQVNMSQAKDRLSTSLQVGKDDEASSWIGILIYNVFAFLLVRENVVNPDENHLLSSNQSALATLLTIEAFPAALT